MSDTAVMGLDAGGTSTRVVIVGADGEVLASARGEGANPTTHGAALAATRVGAAVSSALARAARRSGLEPANVAAATIGLAGLARFRDDPAGRAALDSAWREAGLTCPYTLVEDALIAYAAGTSRPDGTVVIAGTGTIAASVRGFALDRLAGGHGWLLGDEGSGFWLGREAVRAALSDLDHDRALGPLTGRVLTAALGSARVDGRRTAQALVQWATNRPPAALAALAPLVLAEYDRDPAAWALIELAAARLAETTAIVRPPATGSPAPGSTVAEDDQPIVLAGGLLAGGTPLTRALTGALAAACPGAEISLAGDTAAAAAWLAAREVPNFDGPADLHRRLVTRPWR